MRGNLLTIKDAHPREAYDAVLSPDGTLIATAGGNKWEEPGEVKLWDARTGELKKSLVGHQEIAWKVRFSPDGRLLASTGRDGTLRLWSIPSGELQHTFRSNNSTIWGLAFSQDGRRVAGGMSQHLIVWDVQSHEQLLDLRGHSGLVYDIRFHDETNRIASCSSHWDGGPLSDKNDEPSRGEVQLWNAKTGERVRRLDGPLAQEVGTIAFSHDGKRLAASDRCPGFSTGVPSGARVWDLETGRVLQTLEGHVGRILTVAFHPDGRQLATGGDDSSIRVWDLDTGKPKFTLHGHTSDVSGLSYSADGRRLISAGGYDHSVRVWDSRFPVGSRSIAIEGNQMTFSISPDSHSVALIGKDGRVRIHELAGDEVRILDAAEKPVSQVQYVPRHNDLVAGFGNGKTVYLWNTRTGAIVGTLEFNDRFGFRDTIHSITFSPDGRRVALGSWTGATQFFDVETRRAISEPTLESEHSAHDLAFNPDGTLFASCGENQVRVWSMANGRLTFKHDKLGVDSHVLFSPDGQLLAACGYESFVQLYDARTGEKRRALQRHDSGWIHGLSFLKDNSRIATGGMDGNVKIWDVATGRELFSFHNAPSMVQRVQFSPDGRWLAAMVGNKLLLWDGQPK